MVLNAPQIARSRYQQKDVDSESCGFPSKSFTLQYTSWNRTKNRETRFYYTPIPFDTNRNWLSLGISFFITVYVTEYIYETPKRPLDTGETEERAEDDGASYVPEKEVTEFSANHFG